MGTRSNKLARLKVEQISRARSDAAARLAHLSDEEFLIAGVALYAGEGGKRDGEVTFANNDPRMILFFCSWLRRFFDVEESRLRLRLYLHEGLDLEEASEFWSKLTDIPRDRFRKPYRAVADHSIRKTKHARGCPSVVYACSRTHREIMALIEALLSWPLRSGVAQSGSAAHC